MGHVQKLKKEESEMDAFLNEVQSHIDYGDYMTCECSTEGYEHLPLPLVKGTYGN